MNTTIADVLKSKKHVRGSSVCFSPKEYLEPAIETMLRAGVSEDNIKVTTSHATVNANEDGAENISYARVIVEAVVPGYENLVLGNDAKLLFMYALDKQYPSFKIASGRQVRACTNLMVWSDGDVKEFKDDYLTAHCQFDLYRNELAQKQEKFVEFHNALQNQSLFTEESHKLLGFLLTNVDSYKYNNTSYGQTCVTTAAKLLKDKNSLYHTRDLVTDGWNIFGALTQHFTDSSDKSFYQRPDKTMALVEAFKASGFFPNLVSLN